MRRLTIIIGLLCFASAAHAQTATVTWGSIHQAMDGWGGQTVGPSLSLNSTQADLLFSPTAGIGLEYIRTQNTAGGTYPDLGSLQLAVARGALVELGLQSPPASMKVSGTFNDGTGGIITADYGAYATYIVNQINLLASNGVPVAVVDVQNEPDITPSSLGACLWTATQFHDFISGFLGPALASAGLHPKVMFSSNSGWFDNDLVSTCLTDASCAQYVSIVSGHGYGFSGAPDGFTPPTGYCCHTAVSPPGSASGKEIWQSEVNGGFAFDSMSNLWTWDTTMADALVWARNIHDYLTIPQISGWQYWALTDCCNGPFNDGYTDNSYNVGKRYYTVGNWSKFVRSGWTRIDMTSNPATNVYCTAFKAPTGGTFAIVCTNQGGSGSSVAFTLSGFSPTTSVTPYITDGTRNLASQTPITVSGLAFSATIPANSVETFSGAAGPVSPVANLYITQSGSGGGTSCADPLSAAFFNNASNWGSSATIAPGTTVHLCGTFTGSAGGTMLAFQGSGTSGNPITVFAEPGAVLTAPYWANGGSGHGGAINPNGQNYINIIGGPACGFNVATRTTTTCNGIIRNSANGTGLANQQGSLGIEVFNSNNVNIEYWQINNMYNRSGTGTDPNPVDPNTINAIKVDGTSNNVTIGFNSLNNDSWAIDATDATDNLTIVGNDIFNNCHSAALSSAHWSVNGNHFHDWANWNSGAFNICHEDGVHCYVNNTAGNTQLGQLYNNYFDGDTGTNAQQFFFPEGSGSSSVCVVPGGKLYVYNNVAIQNLASGSHQEAMLAAYGNATTGDVGDVYANNTLIGTVVTNSDPSTSAMIFQNSTSLTAANNAVGAGGVLISGFTFTATTFDNNAYQNCGAGNCWSPTGIDTSSFSAWQAFTCTGSANSCDQHGLSNISSSTYFNLPATCVPGALAPSCAPVIGSPLIGAGTNLTSLCSGALSPLCSDIAGNPRPTSGAWAIGAFQSGSVPASPQGVIGGKVLMSGKISLQY